MEIVLSLHSMQQSRCSHRQRREQYWVQGTYDERQGCRPRPDFVFAKRTSYTTPSVQHKPTKNKDSSCCVPVPRTDSSTYQHYSSCNMNTHSRGSRLGTLRNFEVYFEKKNGVQGRAPHFLKSKHDMYLIRGSVGASALFLPIRQRIS